MRVRPGQPSLPQCFAKSGSHGLHILLEMLTAPAGAREISWVRGPDSLVSITGEVLIEAFAWETEPGYALHLLNYTNPNMTHGAIRLRILSVLSRCARGSRADVIDR